VAELVLDRLRELQEADLELRRLEQKKASHDRTVRVRADQIRKHQEHIQALKNTQRGARMEADRKELDIKQKRAEIEKLRAQQMQIKDNRQFQVLQNEIKFAELAISKIEDDILSDLGDLETLAADIRHAEEELGRFQQDLDALRREADARKDDVDQEIARCRAKREAIAKGLPPRVVDQFTRIADRLDGEALAPVIRDADDPDGGIVCGGCHMSIIQNTYVRLAGRSDDLCTCPNCTRILYLEDA